MTQGEAVPAFLIVVCFCALSVFALLAYITGERIRGTQRREVAEYVIRRRAVLLRLRAREQERRELKKAQEEAELAPLHEIPEDEDLVKGLKYVQQVATEAPQVVATVVRTYVRTDPGALAMSRESPKEST